MRPRITSKDAAAFDAHFHVLESAGALEFVNEYSGLAALAAPYNAFAELKLACPLLKR